MSTNPRTGESETGEPATDHAGVAQYEIRVSGRLGTRWAAWFDGMALAVEDDGTTAIRGPVVDQAALHGVLQKLRDLGITLLSLTPLDPSTPAHQPAHSALATDPNHHHASGATS